MTVTKYHITSEGFIPYQKVDKNGVVVEYVSVSERDKCPNAFLLSEDESQYVGRARQVMIDVLNKYANIPPESTDVDPVEFTQAVNREIVTALQKKRLSIRRLKALSYKLQSSLYWSLRLIEVKISNGFMQRYRLTTSDPDRYPEIDIDRTTHPDFFKADNLLDRAKALGIPDIYFYIGDNDLNTLLALKFTFDDLQGDNAGVTSTSIPEDLTYLTVISDPILNAFSSIGRNVKTPTVKKGRNEKGRQIDITEYATNIGITLSFEDYNPFNAGGDISVGDPNTDKLILQINQIVRKSKQQSFEIPMSDFMSFRGISDRKTALSKAKKACDTLLSAKYRVNSDDIHGGVNYVQECYVVTKGKQSGRGGNKIYVNLSDKLYQHIILYADEGRQIEQLDKRSVTIPDNYTTAYNIFRKYSSHLRTNPDRPTSHRLSVKTLLDYSCLPIYPTTNAENGKAGYLRFPSEAKDRIIRPFVEALEYLVDNGFFTQYTFTHTNGQPLTNDEVVSVYDDYKLFSSLNVDVIFTNEPDYTHLIGERSRQKSKADKVRKSTNKTKSGKG